MYHGNFEPGKAPARRKARRNAKKRMTTLVLSLVFVLALGIGGTLAFLSDHTTPVTNTFEPAQVSCKVTETFDGTTKSKVNVTNTSNIPAYIRVKLVTYRVNSEGQHIGGTATIPDFTPGQGWVKQDEYYYYTIPVEAGKSPETDLIESINLTATYPAPDGGKQVIEVMAEAIQSVPTDVVAEKWSVSVSEDGTLTAESDAGGIAG